MFPKQKLSESGDMRQVIDGKQKERGFFKKKEREQYAFGNELGTQIWRELIWKKKVEISPLTTFVECETEIVGYTVKIAQG